MDLRRPSMTILPLVERQLRVRARSPACYWARSAAALGGILVCLPSLAIFTGITYSQAEMGAFAFNGLVVAAFILCCFSGFLTVDGISRERREGTLGLLFLTRVTVLDVLLGNFGAAGLAGLCALAAVVPVLIIPILTGGVSGGEAARKVLALFDTMILSLAAGLWASARGRAWWSCARSAALLLMAAVLGPLLLGWPGPLAALEAADDLIYRKAAGFYWCSIVVIHALSWLLLFGAGIRLRRALRQDEQAPASGASRAVTHKAPPDFMLANIKMKFQRHKPLAEREAPLAWLMRRQRGIRTLVWAGALLETAYYSGNFFFARFISGTLAVYSIWGMGLAIGIVQGCLFAWAASRYFAESRRDGELELLMTTPEGARNMLASQWQWLKKVFCWPTMALAAPSVVMSLAELLRQYKRWDGFLLYVVSSQLFFAMTNIAGVGALLWLGMWCGWSGRSQGRAIARIVILAKGVPYLIGMLGSIVIRGIFPITFGYANAKFGASMILVWNFPQFVILLYYFYLFRWARRRLEAQLGPTLPEGGVDSLLKSIYQPG
jgi:hypothetical protein